MKRLKHIIYMLLPLLAGCSSIWGSTSETIVLDSKIPDMYVEVYDTDNKVIEQGRTPLAVNLKKGRGYFLKEHYKIKAYHQDGSGWEHELTPQLSLTYLFNLVVPWGQIGMLTIDPYSGSMWTFYQDTIILDEEK